MWRSFKQHGELCVTLSPQALSIKEHRKRVAIAPYSKNVTLQHSVIEAHVRLRRLTRNLAFTAESTKEQLVTANLHSSEISHCNCRCYSLCMNDTYYTRALACAFAAQRHARPAELSISELAKGTLCRFMHSLRKVFSEHDVSCMTQRGDALTRALFSAVSFAYGCCLEP